MWVIEHTVETAKNTTKWKEEFATPEAAEARRLFMRQTIHLGDVYTAKVWEKK